MVSTIAGHLAEFVLAVTALEAVVLWRRGRAAWLANLAAGFAMVLAVRLACGAAGWWWIALSMAAGGLAHGIDLRRRSACEPAPAAVVSAPDRET